MNTSNSLPAQADEDDDKNQQYQQQQHKTDNDSNELSYVNRACSSITTTKFLIYNT